MGESLETRTPDIGKNVIESTPMAASLSLSSDLQIGNEVNNKHRARETVWWVKCSLGQALSEQPRTEGKRQVQQSVSVIPAMRKWKLRIVGAYLV